MASLVKMGAVGSNPTCGPEDMKLEQATDNQLELEFDRRKSKTNPKAKKIDAVIVRKIRALEGKLSQAKIADKFGVSQPWIKKILSNEVWKDV